VAEYLFLHTGFASLSLVPEDCPYPSGNVWIKRKDVIDMSVPTSNRNYDKMGCKLLVKDIKHHIFGNSNVKLTKERGEAFFNDDSNFVL
jgi:hypothetical protein